MADPDIRATRNRSFAAGAAVGAVATLLIGLGVSQTVDANRPQPTTTVTTAVAASTSAPTTTQVDLARRDPADVMALGEVDAPVVIVEFADYRCPFCSRFEQVTLPEIKQAYIDTGLVRLEFRDMPIFGDQSVSTALAGRAAGAQGRFWEFMNVVAANGVAEGGHPDLTNDRLVTFAQQAGVPDIDRFTADLSNEADLELVKQDYLLGQQMGTSGVPMFWIADTPMSGAQPFENFSRVIDAELEQAGVRR